MQIAARHRRSSHSANLPAPDHGLSIDRRWTAPVEDAMTPGAIVVVEDATLAQVRCAMCIHGVDLLVVGRINGMPLGWITATGLLGHLDDDPWRTRAVDLITEAVTTIRPASTLRAAAVLLSNPGVHHLLVSPADNQAPHGILTAIDLAHR